jgi:hypothetical protein
MHYLGYGLNCLFIIATFLGYYLFGRIISKGDALEMTI